MRRLSEGGGKSSLGERGQLVDRAPSLGEDWETSTDASGGSRGGSGREMGAERRGEGEGEVEEGWDSEEAEVGDVRILGGIGEMKSELGTPSCYSSIGGEGWTIV